MINTLAQKSEAQALAEQYFEYAVAAREIGLHAMPFAEFKSWTNQALRDLSLITNQTF